MSGVASERPGELQPAAVVGRLHDPPAQARGVMFGWQQRRVQQAADQPELKPERTMGQAVHLEKGRWGRGIDTQPRQHRFNANLDEWVRAFWANAELDAGTAPQLEASLVVGVEWKGGGGGGHEPSASFRGNG